jgi:hypothetical protein
LHDTSAGTAELAALMPNAGLPWQAMFGSSGMTILFYTTNYVGQWESLLARWQSDDLGLLQPEMACPCYWAGWMLITSVFAFVGKREVELTGQSAGGRLAGGQSSVVNRYADIEAQT